MHLTYMVVALLGINSLMLGLVLGVLIAKPKSYKANPLKADMWNEEEPVAPKDLEELERRKKELIAQNEAFQKLMGYNTDMAYGLIEKGGDE